MKSVDTLNVLKNVTNTEVNENREGNKINKKRKSIEDHSNCHLEKRSHDQLDINVFSKITKNSLKKGFLFTK